MNTLKEDYPVYYNFALTNGGALVSCLDDLFVFRCHRKHNFYLSITDVKTYNKNIKENRRGKWCDICRRSNGEQEIEKVLISLSLIYMREKPFPTLIHRHLLRFDFYIPKYVLLIEFDGNKHFPDVREMDSKEIYIYISDKLLDQLKRDQKKNEWCRDNNHSLLRIPYWYFDFLPNLIRGTIRYIEKNNTTILVDDLEEWRLDSIYRASINSKILIPEKKPLLINNKNGS